MARVARFRPEGMVKPAFGESLKRSTSLSPKRVSIIFRLIFRAQWRRPSGRPRPRFCAQALEFRPAISRQVDAIEMPEEDDQERRLVRAGFQVPALLGNDLLDRPAVGGTRFVFSARKVSCGKIQRKDGPGLTVSDAKRRFLGAGGGSVAVFDFGSDGGTLRTCLFNGWGPVYCPIFRL